jgi:hypothetical protein
MSDTNAALKLGSRRCQCAACAARFNSVIAFERHRTGRYGHDRRCLTADEMLAKGMAVNAGGYWVTSIAPAGLVRLKQAQLHTE